MPRFFLFCFLATFVLGTGWGPAPVNAKLVHGVVWYGEAANDAIVQVAARRYSMGASGKAGYNDYEKVRIKQLNPGFRWFDYNSGTDNYVPPNEATQEHDALRRLALQKGWDPEIAYLHFWDDTQVELQGVTLLIRGWGGGTATDPAQSRVPVYYSNLTRRLCNFSTPQAAALYREVMVRLAFDTPYEGSTVYPDGIFLDNCTPIPFNYGRIITGGHVRETPRHVRLDSREFQDWWWDQNLAPYLSSLKDTLETSASWAKDRRQKYLMINVANVWDDDLATRDVADILSMEFQYNPVRNFGLDAIPVSYQRDASAAARGTNSMYLATNTQTVSGREGSFSLPEVMLGNLCWFLLARSPNSIFCQLGSSDPGAANWDSLTWIGAMDVANNYLGEALAPPYVLAQGTDPLGNPYAVHARQYQGGLVVLRNRGSYDEGIETRTAINVRLPRFLQPIAPDGTMGPLVGNVLLRNGQAALFLNALVTPVKELSLTVTWVDRSALVTWQMIAGSDNVSGFDVYRGGDEGSRVKLNEASIPPDHASFLDEHPLPEETRYWLAEISRTGDVSWHGPATLAPGPPVPGRLLLAQSVPNPFRAGAGTLIQFEIAHAGPVSLQMFDLNGRQVAELVSEALPTGKHSVSWNGRDERGVPLPPGVYFYRLNTTEGSRSRKLLLAP